MKILTYLIMVCFLVSSCNDDRSVIEGFEQKEEAYFAKKLYYKASPDGTKNLEMGEIGKDSATGYTQVLIDFKGCGGGIYCPRGINLNIKTYWKNNDTIVIETKKEYRTNQKHMFMQCFINKVIIVYIEK